jgi:hypothetical protein
MWQRDENLCVECAVDAERFIENVGFVSKQKAGGRRQAAEGRRVPAGDEFNKKVSAPKGQGD